MCVYVCACTYRVYVSHMHADAWEGPTRASDPLPGLTLQVVEMLM